MRCSPGDHRWHDTFIFACARLDVYSTQVGKVRRVSYDGNKQPWQPAQVRSPLAAHHVRTAPGPAEDGLWSIGHHVTSPSATALARDAQSYPKGCAPSQQWQITPVFWICSLQRPRKRFIIYRHMAENIKYVHRGPHARRGGAITARQ